MTTNDSKPKKKPGTEVNKPESLDGPSAVARKVFPKAPPPPRKPEKPEVEPEETSEVSEVIEEETEGLDEVQVEGSVEEQVEEQAEEQAEESVEEPTVEPDAEEGEVEAEEPAAEEAVEGEEEPGDEESVEEESTEESEEQPEDSAEETVEEATETQAEDSEDKSEEAAEELAEESEEEAAEEPAEEQPEEEQPEEPAEEPKAKHAAAPFKDFSIPIKPDRKGLKTFAIAAGSIAAVLGVAYCIGAIVFMGRFLPNTYIGDAEISMMSDEEVMNLVTDMVDSYTVTMGGNTFSYEATAEDLGMAIDPRATVNSFHSYLSPWRWPIDLVSGNHDLAELLVVGYRPPAYEDSLRKAVEAYNESAKPSANATVVYDDFSKAYVVKPESYGSQLNFDAVMSAFGRAISALQPTVELTKTELIAPTLFSNDKKLVECAKLANGLTSARITLVMAGNPVSEVNGDNLSQFVSIDESLNVAFKEDDLNAWAAKMAADFNTMGSTRSYTRPDGKLCTVTGGDYGWGIDQAALKEQLLDAIKEGEVLELDIPFSEKGGVYRGAGEQDWGKRYIDVDISEQYVRFYGDDGTIIWESDCVTGKPDGKHDTVQGVWSLNDKESPSVLRGYENGKKIYEQNVTYWLPFEDNSIGFHDATWQPAFGGRLYAQGYGSHGCVNLPFDKVKELYSIIRLDDVVVVHS